ncbi:TPR-like protein [Aulographum hederae CBS 113979]|uniref:ER membrane protein complex subunit 2 n=1 Tax=Aulographum hederae CBS 113979 TaxID=1176131 RepID=A0A6G1GNM9_9PEZI|nr:TPR-like protein [Aulographum hederae CBS 113979]
MSTDLVNPPVQLQPEKALHLSQLAPQILKSSPTTSLPYPLSLLTTPESQETWVVYENLVFQCLRTGDDDSAKECLDRLVDRFGEDNERIMALCGMYEEAVAKDDKELEGVLKTYNKAIQADPTNMLLRKRKIALLKSLSRTNDAISSLVELLDASPIDSEAWAELSELYFSQGMYQQAIFSLEEVLLITPNAWTIHARLGEILYIHGQSPSVNDAEILKSLSESMRRFCRSLELCNDYLRGYYGLKLTTKRLLDVLPSAGKQSDADLPPPSTETVHKLHELATRKLAEIVRRSASKEKGWEGFDPAEIIAARELLDRETQKVDR